MGYILSGLWFVFFLFLSTPLHAAREGSFTLQVQEGGCRSFSYGLTISSDHTEKGDRNGALNQRNLGKLGECFFDKDRRFYRITGALSNSQWGPTLVHGYGIRFRSLQLWRLSAEGGYEATLTYYERGCPSRGPYAHLGCFYEKRFAIAPLPMLYVGTNFELPSIRQLIAPFMSPGEASALPRFMQLPMGELTIGQRTLGYPFFRNKERIHLRTITITHRF